MADSQAKRSGGGGIQSVSCGCPHALRTGRRGPSRATGRTSRRIGRGIAGFFERHHSCLFQSRRGGADHVIYRVRHRTTYDYQDLVSVSHHLVRLTPRNLPAQVCRGTQISILPAPPITVTHNDYFGNIQTFFTLQEPHTCLIVEASSELEVYSIKRPDFSGSPPWETVVTSVEWEQVGNWPTTRASRFPEDVHCWRRSSTL